jgi:Flp pilus assembly protein TadG
MREPGCLPEVRPRNGRGHRANRIALLARSRDGNALIEFALIGSIFSVILLNVVDFAVMIWAQMQVDYAAQAGVQAAYNTCAPGTMPATTNCVGLPTAVSAAAQSTSLGSVFNLGDGSLTLSEGYYCTVNGGLQFVASYTARPSPYNCTAVGSPTTTPGDYLTVNVSYAFTPLFAGLSFAAAQTLNGMGMQRLQ